MRALILAVCLLAGCSASRPAAPKAGEEGYAGTFFVMEDGDCKMIDDRPDRVIIFHLGACNPYTHPGKGEYQYSQEQLK